MALKIEPILSLGQCSIVVPQRWHTAEHRCTFDAVALVDGVPMCGTHLRVARTNVRKAHGRAVDQLEAELGAARLQASSERALRDEAVSEVFSLRSRVAWLEAALETEQGVTARLQSELDIYKPGEKCPQSSGD